MDTPESKPPAQPLGLLVLDFETYYDDVVTLKKLTTWEYIHHSQFEVLALTIKFQTADMDKPVKLKAWGPNVPKLVAAFNYNSFTTVAHNGQFDFSIMSAVYGIEVPHPACTLCMAAPFEGISVGGSLDALARKNGLQNKGTAVHDMKGKRLSDFTAEQIDEYLDYCMVDTELCWDLYHIYRPRINQVEWYNIATTLKMYYAPRLMLDPVMVAIHLEEVKDAKKALQQRVAWYVQEVTHTLGQPLTPDELKAIFSSNDKFAELLRAYDCEPPMKANPKGKMIYAFAKTDPGFEELLESEDPIVAELAAYRMSAKSTIEETRTVRFQWLAEQGAVPFPLKYYGADTTGRWSAWDSVNFQNIPRKSALRAALMAPPGYTVVSGDESQVELRTGLWLAGQDDRLDLLRKGEDLYKLSVVDTLRIAIEAVTKDQRQMGKVTQLSAIFGTSHKTVRQVIWTMAKVRVDEGTAKSLVDTYRQTHPMVVAAWKEGERALEMLSKGIEGPIWGGKCYVTKEGIRRPAGLMIRYPNLRKQLSAEGRPEWVYDRRKGRASITTKIYGAKVFQNNVQGIARDVIAEVVARLYPLQGRPPFFGMVGLVHDEVVGIVPNEYVQPAAQLLHAALTVPVSWAPAIPLACEVETGPSYGDTTLWRPH